ncbi:MAG TPA: hypothetical protein VJX68_03750 [Candidatus Binatus sp.]|nr:hypothetical protein [Candidatus Binatus sp.]
MQVASRHEGTFDARSSSCVILTEASNASGWKDLTRERVSFSTNI